MKKLKENWVDTPEYHTYIHESFCVLVNDTPQLKELRDWVEANHFGFGERSFYWMWFKLVQVMPKQFSFLEIGVFRSQTLALIKLLSDMANKKVERYGVTPLNTADGHWESDYKKDGETIHDQFGLQKDYHIIKGYSQDITVFHEANQRQYNIVYIDGGHTYDVVTSDLRNYPNMVKVNGYLVIDDSANDLKMEWGYFQGIEAVTKAVLEWENEDFEFQFNVVHIKVYKRIK